MVVQLSADIGGRALADHGQDVAPCGPDQGVQDGDAGQRGDDEDEDQLHFFRGYAAAGQQHFVEEILQRPRLEQCNTCTGDGQQPGQHAAGPLRPQERPEGPQDHAGAHDRHGRGA